MEYEFVDKKINISRGKKAEELLKTKNDKEFLKDGIIKEVPLERWKEAQEYEKETWCFSNARGMSTDRNEDHRNKFRGYNQLNIHFHYDGLSLIELGCGPFTNLRLIIPELYRTISKVDLLDPLINDYVKHTQNCHYKSGYLSTRKVNLLPYAIEDFDVQEQYDIIVMMNVLEHCRDIDLIFEKIKKMMHKNSIFLFHDTSFEDGTIAERLNKRRDAGHPILLSTSYLNKLIKNFKVIFENGTLGNKENEVSHYLILKYNG